MKNGKGIKVIIVLVVVIALVVIGGLKIKNVYDGFMDEPAESGRMERAMERTPSVCFRSFLKPFCENSPLML